MEFGARATSSYIAYLAGGTAAAITGFCPIAIGASFLTNFGIEAGRLKYNYYNGLKKTIVQNDRIIKRLKLKLPVFKKIRAIDFSANNFDNQ